MLDSGSYTTTSIVETGWTYNDRNSSSMDQIRANATNFLYSKLYDFAYYSGHGGRTGGIATLNTVPSDPSSASGTYSQFNVAETLVQAVSRDILAYAMKTLRHGFIVGSVHDELIIECSPDVSLQAVCDQMGRTPPWIPGLLLRADGYECQFYKKE